MRITATILMLAVIAAILFLVGARHDQGYTLLDDRINKAIGG